MEFGEWSKLALLYIIHNLLLAQCIVRLETKLGRIKGTHMYSRDGRKFHAFLGVPFAEPPIGELRFQNPKPITEPWLGTLDATQYPPLCPQFLGTLGFLGEEDCLYLNVYTPFLPNTTNSNTKLPVWVWIYPGRRLFGDTHPYHYGPEYIMDKPVVFVCANYRMNVVGFFSTEDDSASGNYGLKDQSAALQWIQNHISEFGGDPTNVTISGESSGAVDVGLHLVSPLSKGLFHRAIAQSGHAMNYRAVVTSGQNLRRAWEFAKLVGCKSAAIISSESLVECMRNVPIRMLTINMYGLMYDHILPHTFFGINIEKEHTEGAFITEHPMINMNKNNSVPWMLGINTDEGSQKLLGVIHGEELKCLFNQPRIFPPILDGPDRKISDLIINFWYNFVAFGDPNGRRKLKTWKPVSSPNIEYLYISETVSEMRSNPCWDEYNFWKSIGSPPLLKPDVSLQLFKDSKNFH
ncbi:hypothetical protein V9T40_002462 [Parthenolecanium corni]|uniref:Carboxylic ester hydrolase n=1 Tax=Parthenolecanium corni TaxID=536013 RepID=A0AAN9TKI3_9HEMI